MLELDNADFLTLRNVKLEGGTIGLHVHNQSTELNAANIRVVNATAQGVLIDSGSSAQVLQGFTVTGTNGPGFKMQGALGSCAIVKSPTIVALAWSSSIPELRSLSETRLPTTMEWRLWGFGQQ